MRVWSHALAKLRKDFNPYEWSWHLFLKVWRTSSCDRGQRTMPTLLLCSRGAVVVPNGVYEMVVYESSPKTMPYIRTYMNNAGINSAGRPKERHKCTLFSMPNMSVVPGASWLLRSAAFWTSHKYSFICSDARHGSKEHNTSRSTYWCEVVLEVMRLESRTSGGTEHNLTWTWISALRGLRMSILVLYLMTEGREWGTHAMRWHFTSLSPLSLHFRRSPILSWRLLPEDATFHICSCLSPCSCGSMCSCPIHMWLTARVALNGR